MKPGLQASSYGARKVLGTLPATISMIKIVKQDGVEKRPNRTSSCVVPKFMSLPLAKPLQSLTRRCTMILACSLLIASLTESGL